MEADRRVWFASIALACLATAVLTVGAAAPVSVDATSTAPTPADGGFTLPSTPGGDKTLTFSISGAEVHQVVGAPEGTYEGTITGDKVTLSGSGTFTMGDNLVTYLSMSASISADGVSKSMTWPAKGGSETVNGPLDWAQSFSVEVPVVKGTTSAVAFSVEVRNCGDWVCGAVGASGMLSGWIPLCDDARQFFGDQADAYDKRGIRTGIDSMSAQVQNAIDRWESEHASKTTMTPGGDAIAAGMWLFSDGGVNLSPWTSSFSLSPDPGTPAGEKLLGNVTVNQLNGKLFSGSFNPPPGSESALAQSIALTATRDGRHLAFGDVYRLALDQTGGDTMLAALLAHNTLRSLARTGTVGITGLAPDPTFFTKYLTTLRDGDNSGVWYHTFGTMYYQLEVAQGTSVGSKVYSTLGVAGAGVLYIPSWLFSNATEYFLGWNKPFRFQQMLEGVINGALPTTSTGWSGFANAAEQAYREIYGSNKPDPEKFCFNVWGTRLAQMVHDRLFPTTPFQIFDSTRTNPYSNLAGDTTSLDPPTGGATSPDGAPYDPTEPLPRLGGTGSPVDVLLDVNGVQLFLDQESGVIAANGDFPYPVWPYLTDDGHYGLWWVVPPGQAEPTITYTATDSGATHQFSADPSSGRITVWTTDVTEGDTLTWTPPAADTDGTSDTAPGKVTSSGTMTDDRGREVTPQHVDFSFSADGHLLVADSGTNVLLLVGGACLLAAAMVAGALLWRRRGRPQSARPNRRALPPPRAAT